MRAYSLDQVKEWYWLFLRFGTMLEVINFLKEKSLPFPSYKTIRSRIKDLESSLNSKEKKSLRRKKEVFQGRLFESYSIIPVGFWSAFFDGKYPDKFEKIDALIQYKDILKNNSFLQSKLIEIDRNKVCIFNFIVIKGAFFILLTSLRERKDLNRRVIGFIFYNFKSKIIIYNKKRLSEIKYHDKLLQKIENEFRAKKLLFEEKRKVDSLIFKLRMEQIALFSLWIEQIKCTPNCSIEQRVEVLTSQLETPVSRLYTFGKESSDELVRKEAYKLWYKLKLEKAKKTHAEFLNSEDYYSLTYGDNKFNNIENIKDEYSGVSILKEGFWEAFRFGNYPSTNKGFLDYRIEKFANLLEGIGYTNTIIRSNYVINVVSVKQAFLILVFTYGKHSRGSHSRLLGVIDYNPRRKISELYYYVKGTARDNPIALIILNKIKRELLREIEISDTSRDQGKLPFFKPIKIICCTQLWRKLKDQYDHLGAVKIAERISLMIKLEPVSVAGYTTFSFDKQIRSDAYLAENRICDSMHNITQTWRSLKEVLPSLSTQEIIEKISIREEIDPISVAAYARFSEDKLVKRDANKVMSILMDSLYEISSQWESLITNSPQLSPEEKAIMISEDISLSAVSVAGYAISAKNPEVSKEANKAFSLLKAAKFIDLINKDWTEKTKINPSLEPEIIIKEISDSLELKPVTVAKYACSSNIPFIKKSANIARFRFQLKMHGIEELWSNLIESNPSLTSLDIVDEISSSTDLKPITIAGAARYSQIECIKKQANNAMGFILEKKYNITNKYLAIENKFPNFSPLEIFEQIAKESKIKPSSLCSAALYSKDPRIKYNADKCRIIIHDQGNDITKYWNSLITSKSTLRPWEKCSLVANKSNLCNTTVLRRALFSSNPNVAFEARITKSKNGGQGIFNKDFETYLEFVLNAINEAIKRDDEIISTNLLSHTYYNLSNKLDNGIRNQLAYCLSIIVNFNIITKNEGKVPYEYQLPKEQIKIKEFIKTFQEELDYSKIFKNMRKLR